MHRPSLGEWLIPIVISGFAVVTAWAGHRMEMKLWVSVVAYAILVGLAYGAYRYRLREYRRWRDRDREEAIEHEMRFRKKVEEMMKAEELPRKQEEDRRYVENVMTILNHFYGPNTGLGKALGSGIRTRAEIKERVRWHSRLIRTANVNLHPVFLGNDWDYTVMLPID